MVFTEKDHVAIKFLRRNKGYSAIGARISVENLKIGGLNKLKLIVTS